MYFIGRCNVGKSSLINALMKVRGPRGGMVRLREYRPAGEGTGGQAGRAVEDAGRASGVRRGRQPTGGQKRLVGLTVTPKKRGLNFRVPPAPARPVGPSSMPFCHHL